MTEPKMVSASQTKPHVVCIPFPAQGHINPMMQLAKLLHSRGFYVTFVNTEFNHRRLIKSKGPDFLRGFSDFQFETIPDGLPESDKDATQDAPLLCDSTRRNCLEPFYELLNKLNSFPELPAVSCIISDGVMSFAIKAAGMIGVPEVQFWTASACGFMGYLQYEELIKREIVPFKDENFDKDGTLDTSIDWIAGMKSIRLKDIPSFIRTTNSNDIMLNFMGSEAQNCLNSSAIILNTFDSLEHEVLEIIASNFPNIYAVGPLQLLNKLLADSPLKSFRSNLWQEDYKCLEWLDKREQNSVVYVNYGCVTVMSDEHLKEFAWGLANSRSPFLWVIRPDLVMGDSAVLPVEFLEQIKDRALLVSWCPQDQVLVHPAIGVFLTHCGWNSMVESICGGVPLICWPFFAEQHTNCRYACTEWGLGMEASHDVKREEIESLVREMMEARSKASEWKRKAEAAADFGGSSYCNFEKFIKEVVSLK